ncbi:MAG TPA: flavin reductase [Elusimicrobia bacterium]|nr:MAG: flavin reductase [Elusimicrobia bacterium GWF2_62_30]HBA60450.1 flavin reductase [Elusimicrobiota bacterium]
MKKKAFPLVKVNTLLQHGPVVMISTAAGGRNNVMTLSWLTMVDFDPPLVGCVISDENRTFGTLKNTCECVINIPTLAIARKALACGSTSGADTDKFAAFGLTPQKASLVKAPLIKECYASLECRLEDSGMSDKYNFFVLKVVKAWVSGEKKPKTLHHLGGNSFMLPGRTVKVKKWK